MQTALTIARGLGITLSKPFTRIEEENSPGRYHRRRITESWFGVSSRAERTGRCRETPPPILPFLGRRSRSDTLNRMSTTPSVPEQDVTLRELYPHLTDAELQDVECRLDEYLTLAFRIWTRIESDPQALAEFEALTARKSHPTIEPERSQPKPSQST